MSPLGSPPSMPVGAYCACARMPHVHNPNAGLMVSFVLPCHLLQPQIIHTVQAAASGSGLAVPPPDALPAGQLAQVGPHQHAA